MQYQIVCGDCYCDLGYHDEDYLKEFPEDAAKDFKEVCEAHVRVCNLSLGIPNIKKEYY